MLAATVAIPVGLDQQVKLTNGYDGWLRNQWSSFTFISEDQCLMAGEVVDQWLMEV